MTIATMIFLVVLATTILLGLCLRTRSGRTRAAAHDEDGPVVRRPVFFEHELV